MPYVLRLLPPLSVFLSLFSWQSSKGALKPDNDHRSAPIRIGYLIYLTLVWYASLYALINVRREVKQYCFEIAPAVPHSCTSVIWRTLIIWPLVWPSPINDWLVCVVCVHVSMCECVRGRGVSVLWELCSRAADMWSPLQWRSVPVVLTRVVCERDILCM